jgi:hypothetical protein
VFAIVISNTPAQGQPCAAERPTIVPTFVHSKSLLFLHNAITVKCFVFACIITPNQQGAHILDLAADPAF